MPAPALDLTTSLRGDLPLSLLSVIVIVQLVQLVQLEAGLSQTAPLENQILLDFCVPYRNCAFWTL